MQIEHAADEVARLQRCIGDLASVLSLPAIWKPDDPRSIADTLLDALSNLLRLEFAYVRLNDSSGAAPIERIRVSSRRGLARPSAELLELVHQRLNDPSWSRSSNTLHMAGKEISVVRLNLGLAAEVGVLMTGCERHHFPAETDRLVLSVAANQAAIAVKEAWLLENQNRFAAELEQRVSERTAELAAAHEEWRQSQEALRQTQAELAHASRVMTLGVLTASIAHEVNQPLASIITNASTCLRMLAADPPNIEGARKIAERNIRDGNRAADVISRLRTLFSKNASNPEPLDLNEAAGEVIALSLNELRRRRVQLRTEFCESLPRITGDRVQLQQVILNLILNASEAMNDIEDRPRDLLIRTDLDELDYVRLTVTDSGIGIAPDIMANLFEPFYTTKRRGMGIGLYVSRSIIEHLQGRISALGNAGHGATFSFSLPRTVEA